MTKNIDELIERLKKQWLGDHDLYCEAAAEIDRRNNCIKAMWEFLGKNIQEPFDNQISFEATYPEYKDLIDKARAGDIRDDHCLTPDEYDGKARAQAYD